jgi:hypothetical protein
MHVSRHNFVRVLARVGRLEEQADTISTAVGFEPIFDFPTDNVMGIVETRMKTVIETE